MHAVRMYGRQLVLPVVNVGVLPIRFQSIAKLWAPRLRFVLGVDVSVPCGDVPHGAGRSLAVFDSSTHSYVFGPCQLLVSLFPCCVNSAQAYISH